MTETPFADAVAAYLRDIPLPLSTPGHKRNPALVGDASLLLSDVPFHGGAETLRNETGILEQAEELAAAAWGADLCRFTHNGSTHPNQALCLATTTPGRARARPPHLPQVGLRRPDPGRCAAGVALARRLGGSRHPARDARRAGSRRRSMPSRASARRS